MTIRTKIVLLMTLTLALYAGFLLYVNDFNQSQVSTVLQESQKKSESALQQAIELLGTSQKNLVLDYSIWDDMVSFLQTDSQKFAKENIDTSLSSFQVDATWVYDLTPKVLYSARVPSAKDLGLLPIPDLYFQTLRREKTGHFFIDTPRGVMEIYGATIHPTSDPLRKTAPYGYFLAGRFLDSVFLSQLSTLVDGQGFLRAHTAQPSAISSDAHYVYRASYDLRDWNREPLAVIDTQVKSSLAENLQNALNGIIRSSVVFGLVVILLLFVLLFYFVSTPLGILARSVSLQNPGKLQSLKKEKSEIGELAQALDLYFSQEQKVGEARSRADALLEGITDGIIGIDRSWKIIFLNKAARELIGWNEETDKGAVFQDKVKIARFRDRSDYLTYVEDAMLYSRAVASEEDVYIVDKIGEELPITTIASPILGKSGKPVGAVVMLHDVKKDREERLLHSDFAYASHQMRTPINRALWAITTALEGADSTTKDTHLEIARTSLESVERLVEHLLVVSRLDQRIVLPVKEKLSVKTFFTGSVALIAKKLHINPAVLRLTYAESLGSFATDPHLLSQALYEVIENAYSYRDSKNEIVISVAQPGDEVIFQVHNLGSAISERELPLVFKRFFRGADAEKLTPGSGLGLYVAREYMNLLGGRIWFTSDPVAGTTFFLSVPTA